MTASSAEIAESTRTRRLLVSSAVLAGAPAPQLAPRVPSIPGGSAVAPAATTLVPSIDRPVAEPADRRPEAPTEEDAACPGRVELRAERQAARRERRRWAVLGLSGLGAVLGATVAVLGVFH